MSSTTASAATAATRSRCFAPVADLSEGEIGVLTLGACPVVVVVGSALLTPAIPIVSESSVVVPSLTVVPSSASVVSETPVVVTSSSVVPSSTTATRSWCFAPVADVSESEIGVLALRARPVVIVERAALLTPAVPIVSETPVVVPSSSVVPSSAPVVSGTPVVVSSPPVLTSVISAGPAFVSLFSGLLFCPDGHVHADERVHVEGAVDVRDVSKRMVGASDDPVDLSDVGTVVGSNHDGVERRG